MRLGAEILLALILAWTFGGVLLRLGGIALLSVGAVGLALGGGATGVLVVGIGAALWVLGQARHLLRHGECRSPPARLLLEGADRRASVDRRSDRGGEAMLGRGRPAATTQRRRGCR